VGKSTLFNRLTGSRRSIVGDEPGITRDRIYGEIEWMGRDARIVDTGGVVPDDEALIPAEIFRQAQVALEEADAIVMVVDGGRSWLRRIWSWRGCCCAAASRCSWR
jgi:GTP-binding protein